MNAPQGFNPTWLIFLVNFFALFVVPYATYRYAHRNNVKSLTEKWLSELRTASSGLVEACASLYYANDMRYSTITGTPNISDAERKTLVRRCEEGQARVEGVCSRTELLFRQDDASLIALRPLIDSLIKSVDQPQNVDDCLIMSPARRGEAQSAFLKKVNEILQSEWSKIIR